VLLPVMISVIHLIIMKKMGMSYGNTI